MKPVTIARHAARRSRALSVALPIGLAVTALGALWSMGAMPAVPEEDLPPMPVAALELPAVDIEATPALNPCADASVQAAIAGGDDAATIAAFGGGERFRSAVAVGNAPCIALDDPARLWIIVNKARPLAPLEFEPTPLAVPQMVTTTASDFLRSETAAALTAMVGAADDAGVGPIGMNNGYRSHGLQVATYSSYVEAEGQESADRGSARPGYSEHQTGLAVDVVSCEGGCGGLDAFGDTPQSEWVQEHAWEYGFVVRYESGATDRTGYMPEPWHLRYIGSELAAAYHEGDFHTLEEFFGLPAAPDYAN